GRFCPLTLPAPAAREHTYISSSPQVLGHLGHRQESVPVNGTEAAWWRSRLLQETAPENGPKMLNLAKCQRNCHTRYFAHSPPKIFEEALQVLPVNLPLP